MKKSPCTCSSLLASFLAIFLASGCQRNGPLTSEPTPEEIAGHYELSRTSFGGAIDKEIMEKVPRPSIELREDFKAIISGLPIVRETEDGRFTLAEFRGGEGRYEITALGEMERHADVKLFYGLYLNCGDLPDPTCSPRLRTVKGNRVLAYDYFNGIFVERMVFTKTEGK